MDPRISIVDDDPSVVRALERLCRSAGYQVKSYESAEDFLAAEESEATDCLILDVHLPGLDGFELQAHLLKTERPVPIIFITAFDGEDSRAKAIEAGARAFLRKPLDTDHLLDVIQDALAGASSDG